MFPALGFGAQLPPDWKVKRCGHLRVRDGFVLMLPGQERSCWGSPAGSLGEKLSGRGGTGGCGVSAGGERDAAAWVGSEAGPFLPAELA